MSQFNQNSLQGVQRSESSLKAINEMLVSLASSYRDGSMFSVKRQVKETKNGMKESCSKSMLVRGATKARIETYVKERQYDRSLQNQDILKKVYHFAGINVVGPIVDIANYFATRLSSEKTYFQSDSAQFAVAAVLRGLVKNGSEFVVDESNVAAAGNVKVLKGLIDYAAAGDNEVAKATAVKWLYDNFVVGMFDTAANAMRQVMENILSQNNSNIGYYNSAPIVRSQIQNQMISILNSYDSFSHLLEREGMYDLVPRQDWLEMKAVQKKKNDANHISLTDLPAVARELGVLSEVVATFPPQYRSEQGGFTYYKGLPIQPQLAHLLWYVSGISFKAAPIDSTPHAQTSEGGKRRVKILSLEEARTRMIKNIAKYFEAGSNGKESNMALLIRKEKFLDITDANPLQATGLQISAQTANTVFLFPNEQVPTIMSKDAFLATPLDVFKFIKSCLGYPAKAEAIKNGHIVEVIRDLHKVFGLTAQEPITYNTVSSKGGSQNAFSSMAPAMGGFAAQQMMYQQAAYQQPPAFQQQAAVSSGDEI